MQFKTLGWFKENETAVSTEKLPYQDCLKKYNNPDSQWVYENQLPNWLTCGFKGTGIPFTITDTAEKVWDFSVSSPSYDYSQYFKDNTNKFNSYAPPDRSKIHRYFSVGFVEPVWAIKEGKSFSHLQLDLFRLPAAADVILWKKPKAKKYDAIPATACVGYPYGILVGKQSLINITKISNTSHYVKCTACILTNCLSNNLQKDFNMIILVKHPAYVMLPVDLKEEWFEDTGLEAIKKLNELLRPKRFVAALILGISALIAIVTSFAVSTAALVKNIQTASFVNDLHKNISLVLAEQHIIDKKLEAKLNALEDVVISLGQDVSNLKARMTTKCHASYKHICITPARYNNSEDWNKTKAHLLGIWKDNDIAYDLQALQRHISEISKQQIESYGFEDLAQQLYNNITALNPLSWWHYIVLAAMALVVIIVVFMIFPCLFRLILKSLQTTRRDVEKFRLKAKSRELPHLSRQPC